MKKIKKSPFKLDQFLIKEFNIKREPKKKGKIDIDIEPSGIIDNKNNQFLLCLEVKLKDDTRSFEIEMTTFGYFTFKENEKMETLSNYFYINAPAIIFPYIRSYISAITALTGIEAVYLPVMNLSYLGEKLKENTIEN